MSLVVHEDYKGVIDFPVKGSWFVIEDNVGDEFPIHIHFGGGEGSPYHGLPNIRIHFTYKEFADLCERMIEGGEL